MGEDVDNGLSHLLIANDANSADSNCLRALDRALREESISLRRLLQRLQADCSDRGYNNLEQNGVCDEIFNIRAFSHMFVRPEPSQLCSRLPLDSTRLIERKVT